MTKLTSDEVRDAFNAIPYQRDNPLEVSGKYGRVIASLTRIAEMHRPDKSPNLSADHDVIYFAHIDDLERITHDDILFLDANGVHWNDDLETLYMFT